MTPTAAAFKALFHPKTIAVVGASTTSVSGGNRFIRYLNEHRLRGTHHSHPSFRRKRRRPSGLCSLAGSMNQFDYAYIAVAAKSGADVILSGRGKVRIRAGDVERLRRSGKGPRTRAAACCRRSHRGHTDRRSELSRPLFAACPRVTFTERTSVEPGIRYRVVRAAGSASISCAAADNAACASAASSRPGTAPTSALRNSLEYFLASPTTPRPSASILRAFATAGICSMHFAPPPAANPSSS